METGPLRLKVSSDRPEKLGIEPGTHGYKASGIYTTPNPLYTNTFFHLVSYNEPGTGWLIVHIKVSKVIISVSRCNSVPEDCFYLNKQ